MSRENVEVALRVIEAINEGDVDGLAAAMAPECKIVPLRAALEGTVYSGPHAAREFWEALVESWSALHVDLAEVRDLDERVLGLGTLTAKGRGTGAEVETQAAFVATIQNGRATELRVYPGHGEALEAVGLRE